MATDQHQVLRNIKRIIETDGNVPDSESAAIMLEVTEYGLGLLERLISSFERIADALENRR